MISFASPFGYFNEDMLITTGLYYKAHVNAWSDENGINRWGTLNPLNIHRWTIRNTDTADDVCARIKNLNDDEVFAIAFHNVVVGEPAADREFDISADTLEGIADCVLENNVYHFRVRDIIGE